MLDERLSLVYDLYEPCETAADIGTDHGLLPCALLKSGKCARMILTDISEKALSHARDAVTRARLENRVRLICGDGLMPVDEPCEFISVTGMGGKTIAKMLEEGCDRLRDAKLILSAHTDLPILREAVFRAGYHFDREKLCFAAGRYYLVFRAVPGKTAYTPEEIRRGSLLFQEESPLLKSYLSHRAEVLREKHAGLTVSGKTSPEMLRSVEADIAFYEERINL